jgi:hypothetical protein
MILSSCARHVNPLSKVSPRYLIFVDSCIVSQRYSVPLDTLKLCFCKRYYCRFPWGDGEVYPLTPPLYSPRVFLVPLRLSEEISHSLGLLYHPHILLHNSLFIKLLWKLIPNRASRQGWQPPRPFGTTLVADKSRISPESEGTMFLLSSVELIHLTLV